MLNIIVCIKAVPDPAKADDIKIDPATHTLIRKDIPMVLNPLDKFAMEAALTLKEKKGGHITVIDGLQGRQMSLIPENRTYIEGEFTMSEAKGDDSFAAVNSLRALPARADEELGEKQGWGHSAVSKTCELAKRSGARQLGLFHHDPERSDAEVDNMVSRCAALLPSGTGVFGVEHQQIIEL